MAVGYVTLCDIFFASFSGSFKAIVFFNGFAIQFKVLVLCLVAQHEIAMAGVPADSGLLRGLIILHAPLKKNTSKMQHTLFETLSSV